MAIQLGITSGYSLLDNDELFARIADGITRAHPEIDRIRAGRILDQAILFVAAAGRFPNLHLSPSPQVDIGWDAFVLYTRDYMEYCGRVAGRFVHHEPSDHPGQGHLHPDGDVVATPAGTAELMRQSGFAIDEGLWPTDDATGPCYSGTHEGDSESGVKPPQ